MLEQIILFSFSDCNEIRVYDSVCHLQACRIIAMLSDIIFVHILSVFLFIIHGWLTGLQEDKVVSAVFLSSFFSGAHSSDWNFIYTGNRRTTLFYCYSCILKSSNFMALPKDCGYNTITANGTINTNPPFPSDWYFCSFTCVLQPQR